MAIHREAADAHSPQIPDGQPEVAKRRFGRGLKPLAVLTGAAAVIGFAPDVNHLSGENGNIAVATQDSGSAHETANGDRGNESVVTAPSIRMVNGEYPDIATVRKNIRKYNARPANKSRRIVFGGALDPTEVKVIGVPALDGYETTGQVDRYAVLWQRKIDRKTNKTVSIYRSLSPGKSRAKLKKGERLYVVRTQEKIVNQPAQLPENPTVISVQPFQETNPPAETPTTPTVENPPTPENPDYRLTDEQFKSKETQKFLESTTVNLEVVNATGTRIGDKAAVTAAHVFYIPKNSPDQVLVERYFADGQYYIVFKRPPIVSGGTSRSNFTSLGEITSVALPAAATDMDMAFVSTDPDKPATQFTQDYNAEVAQNLTTLNPGQELDMAGWPLNESAGAGTENLQRWHGKVTDKTAFIKMGPLPNAQNLSTTLTLFGKSQEGLPVNIWASGMQVFIMKVEGTGPNRRLTTKSMGSFSAMIKLNPGSFNQHVASQFGIPESQLDQFTTLGFVARPPEVPQYDNYEVITLDKLPANAQLLNASN